MGAIWAGRGGSYSYFARREGIRAFDSVSGKLDIGIGWGWT